MASFLDATSVSSTVPKLIELETGTIFNGTSYDKNTLIVDSLEDFVIYGSNKTLSLNRVFNYPVQSGIAPNATTMTRYRGDSIIKDDYELGINYILTFDYENPTRTANNYIAKISETNGVREKILSRRIDTASSYWYGAITQYIGQSKDNLFFICDMGYTYNSTNKFNYGYIMKVNKATLIPSYQDGYGPDRSTYNKIADFTDFAYLLKRSINAGIEIIELRKDSGTIRSIKTIPAFTDEIIKHINTMEAHFTTADNAFIIETPSKNADKTARWIDIQFAPFRPCPATEGVPSNTDDLRIETSYVLNGYKCYGGYSPCPVLDKNNSAGTHYNAASYGAFYWDGPDKYVDITFNEQINLWRSGVDAYPTYKAAFTVKRWNTTTSAWDNITTSITQTLSNLTSVKWEKTISNLPAGRYRFEGSDRMDSCWYIEKASGTDYFEKMSYGLKDGTTVTYVDNLYDLADPAMTIIDLPAGILTSKSSFVTVKNGVKFLNVVSYGLSQTEWNTAEAPKSHITTFRIDEATKKLILTAQMPLSNSLSVAKGFALNSTNTRLIGSSQSNIFILDFDENGKFIPIKYFAYDAWSCGFDKDDSMYILTKNMELLKLNDLTPEKINIEFDSSNLEYVGSPINTSFNIDALSFINQRLAVKVLLTINGNAIFDANGSNQLEINTITDKQINVPITINGPGMVLVYPTLMFDIKKS